MLPRLCCFALALLPLGAGCGDPPAPPPEAPAAPQPALTLSAADLAAADPVALVPAPREMQRALERAGVAQSLASRVSDRPAPPADADLDRVAVYTGVVLADLLLTASSATPAQIGARVGLVHAGLVRLGADAEALAALEELRARVENGALAGDALVTELDELAGSRLPAWEARLSPRALPLVRAGAWLEGASLVSGAMVEAGRFDGATDLLRQPAVVDYFQAVAAQSTAPTQLQSQLQATLEVLDRTTAQPSLGEAEVREIQASTQALLVLL